MSLINNKKYNFMVTIVCSFFTLFGANEAGAAPTNKTKALPVVNIEAAIKAAYPEPVEYVEPREHERYKPTDEEHRENIDDLIRRMYPKVLVALHQADYRSSPDMLTIIQRLSTRFDEDISERPDELFLVVLQYIWPLFRQGYTLGLNTETCTWSLNEPSTKVGNLIRPGISRTLDQKYNPFLPVLCMVNEILIGTEDNVRHWFNQSCAYHKYAYLPNAVCELLSNPYIFSILRLGRLSTEYYGVKCLAFPTPKNLSTFEKKMLCEYLTCLGLDLDPAPTPPSAPDENLDTTEPATTDTTVATEDANKP